MLREARAAGVAVRGEDGAGGIAQRQSLAARGELAGVVAHDEQALAGTRAGRARAESRDARRHVDSAVRAHDRSGCEREVHAAFEPPARDVHRDGIRVAQLDVFLRLVRGGGIELDGTERERRAAELGVGNADRQRIHANIVHVVRSEKMRAARREVVALENRDGRRERVIRAVAGAPAIAVEHGVVGEQRIQLVETRLIAKLIRRRARRLEQFIHQRAQAAQEEFARGRAGVNRVEEIVRPAAVAPDHAVKRMAEVRFAAALPGAVAIRRHPVVHKSNLAEAQILVPREQLPEAGAQRVPIDINVFDHSIPVLRDDAGGEVVDDLGHIQQVEQGGAAIRIRRADAGDQRLEVGVVLVLPGLLFGARCGVQRIKNLVECAGRIEPAACEKVLIHVLDEGRDAEERVVLLDADAERIGRGHAGILIGFERERRVDIGLVLVSRVEVQLFHAGLAGRETEMFSGIEIEFVRLLRERRRARAAHAAEDVVDEFAVPIDPGAGADGGVGGGDVLHEPMKDG